MYYRNANCAVVVYDITQAVSKTSVITRQSLELMDLIVIVG
jgi:hypothetical protein